MLIRPVKFEEQLPLIEGSGIQFLDFSFGSDPKSIPEGNFLSGNVEIDGKTHKIPLVLSVRGDDLVLPTPGHALHKGAPEHSASGTETLKAFEAQWLPVPFFRRKLDGAFEVGPFNWVRVRVDSLDAPDADGNHFRLTMIVDTSVSGQASDSDYLSPTAQDINFGKVFGLATDFDSVSRFATLPWVEEWVLRSWKACLRDRMGRRLSDEQVAERLEDWPSEAMCKFLHFIQILDAQVRLPRIKLLANDKSKPSVDSTLILDIGNSRTCAVILEKHPDQASRLTHSYTLQLRDLGRPTMAYSDPFESRLEFTTADFGSVALSRESGRKNAFLWPTLTRVGPEAARLAGMRRGTEGATGLTSPKRYLWDEDSYPLDWRFNQPGSAAMEPLANEGVFVNLINEMGDALSDLEIDDPNRLPVINPRYSRSSLMTFLISEIFAQTMCQINSAAQRLRMPNSDLPRNLKRIIMTLPPAMPLQEQEILRKRTHQATTLLWQALGYLTQSGSPANDQVPAVPEIIIQYDEATCAQVVWLYSSIVHQYGGSAPAMFATNKRDFGSVAVRPENVLRVASIDIGGGTTDLVISDYRTEGSGNNVTIVPQSIFREGFNIAGDDILKRVIQVHIIRAIEDHFVKSGVSAPVEITKDLFGADRANQAIQIKTLRRQATTQLLAPLGLKLLSFYEAFDPKQNAESPTFTIGQLLEDRPTDTVLNYVNATAVQSGAAGFDILDVPIPIDLQAIDVTVGSGTEINRVLEALCELVYVHNCDQLLLTGRPSRLNGVIVTIKKLLPVPIDRIVEMNGFRSGTWYPFNRLGCIDDPKTTAAVGAMLCKISEPDFLFRSDCLHLGSTTRFIGKMTNDGLISSNDVFYSDVNLNDLEYALPDETFEFRGAMRLGARQLKLERWRATMFYILDFYDDESRARLQSKVPLRVSLKRSRSGLRKGETERFELADVFDNEGNTISRRFLKLRLQTLSDDTGYWLDNGHVKEA